jgi:hypothetical protein
MDVAREYDNGRLYERKKACCIGKDTSLIADNILEWDCSCKSCIHYNSIIESCKKNSILSNINKDIDNRKKIIKSLEEAIDKNWNEINTLSDDREKLYNNASLIQRLSDTDKDCIESILKKGVGMFDKDGIINIIERFPENMERYDIVILVLKSSVVINITTLCQTVQDFITTIVKCDNKDYYPNVERNYSETCIYESDSIKWRRIHRLQTVPRNSYPDGFFDNEITIMPWREVMTEDDTGYAKHIEDNHFK